MMWVVVGCVVDFDCTSEGYDAEKRLRHFATITVAASSTMTIIQCPRWLVDGQTDMPCPSTGTRRNSEFHAEVAKDPPPGGCQTWHDVNRWTEGPWTSILRNRDQTSRWLIKHHGTTEWTHQMAGLSKQDPHEELQRLFCLLVRQAFWLAREVLSLKLPG